MRKLVLGTKPAAVYENLQLCRGSLRLARLGDWFLAVMWTAGMGTYFPWGYIAAAVFPPLIHLTLVTTFSWLFCVCNARTAPWFGHCGRRVRVIFWCCVFFFFLCLSPRNARAVRAMLMWLYTWKWRISALLDGGDYYHESTLNKSGKCGGRERNSQRGESERSCFFCFFFFSRSGSHTGNDGLSTKVRAPCF